LYWASNVNRRCQNVSNICFITNITNKKKKIMPFLKNLDMNDKLIID